MHGTLGHELPVLLLDEDMARKAVSSIFVESFFKSVRNVTAQRRAEVQVFSGYLNGHLLALLGRAAAMEHALCKRLHRMAHHRAPDIFPRHPEAGATVVQTPTIVK